MGGAYNPNPAVKNYTQSPDSIITLSGLTREKNTIGNEVQSVRLFVILGVHTKSEPLEIKNSLKQNPME